MATMEDIIATQEQISKAIEQLYSNFKKDSQERKTPDYIRRRLETLNQYWGEFRNNHINLNSFDDKSHVYFIKNIYEQVHARYDLIYESIQTYVPQTEERPRTPIIKPPSFVPPSHSQATSSKTEDMIRKQGSNFKAFMRTVKGINLELVSEKWEFEDLLRTLQARWSAIDSQHWELDSELNGSNKDYEKEFSDYEECYNNIKKSINRKMWSVSFRESSTPRMDIPNFTGNYSQWTSFKDLFTESIHNNQSISNAQKLQFLKGKLKGEPERLIQHLQISSDNYAICWDILINRYNNKKLIFTSHVNTLLGIPVMQHQSSNHIKRIHDTCHECMNAIKNLGIDIESWDPLLVHLLSQKLDSETYHDYMESVKKPRELPKLSEFLSFLETKFTTLESSRRKQDIKTPSNVNQAPVSKYQANGFQKSNYYNHAVSSSTRAAPTPYNKGASSSKFSKLWCPVCDNGDHNIYFCHKFLNMPPNIKRNTVSRLNLCSNCLFNHFGNPCRSEKRCRDCKRNHNSILHEAFTYGNSTPPRAINGSEVTTSAPATNQVRSNNHVHMQNEPLEVLLATAVIKVQAADGTYQELRALLDQGSQTSLITEHAAQLLNLRRQRCKGVITGVGAKESNCKGMLSLKCKSMVNDFTFEADVLIMKTLIKKLPNSTMPKPNWSYLDHIKLADPEFYKSRPVDILLGADIYCNILMDGICRENGASPTAQQTQLGWILSGNVKSFHCNVIINDLQEIQRFWEMEDITELPGLSEEDQECIQFYQSSTSRKDDGKYEVYLPLKAGYQEKIGESKSKAVAQFYQLERKFNKQTGIAKDYKIFIDEYLSLKHMILAARADGNVKLDNYLPHHCVQREASSTTKLRVVFNASSKTSSGYTLNDAMCRGPNLQQDLQSLIIKWRQYEFAYTADIEKMFRQIWINSDHQRLQKIIWRDNQSEPLQEYQLTTVTYGTKSAPFLAMMTLKRLAQDERVNYQDSQAPCALEESFYMDDFLHGSHSLTEAKKLQKDIIELLQKGGFNLRKWKANKPELLEGVTCDQDYQENFDFKQVESTKTLGLKWNPLQDNFLFQSTIPVTSTKPTKRTLLSDISKLFDPLGWLVPLTTKLKILFQDVWKTNLQWDEPVPLDILKEWNKIKEDIHIINELHVPRWLNTTENDTIELHGFSDASTKAYACVIYCKTNKNNVTSVVLVAAKTKLVPLNKVKSLPRLELSAALLLSKLMTKVKTCLNNYQIKTFGWVDSMVVLAWLNRDAERWKPFVANRVREIIQTMPSDCWRYIKSKENPADCASRGLTASELREHSLWWRGPVWLPEFEPKEEEKKNYITNHEMRIIKQVNVAQVSSGDVIKELLNKYSSLSKAIRVLSWVLRFTAKNKKQDYLSTKELKRARDLIVRQTQQEEFTDEIQNIRSGKPVSNKSKLSALNPILDQDGLLRVGGRLKNANIDPEMKYPIIIPNHTKLADLIIDQSHKLTFHGGPKMTSAFTRQKYWLLGGIRTIKKRLRFCVKCKKHSPLKHYQIMGDLPSCRINPSRPFFHTGIDYTGHVFIKANKGRGIKTLKGYVAVFVCMATKAVHLELVSDLTSSAFLAALRRMTARRGCPGHIYSDQGTNFIGANRILQQELQEIQQVFNQELMTEIAEMEINWHFQAPAWPSAGGIWERMVQNLKYHLKRVIGEQRLTYEEFSTLLAQLEACLNSRPLCSLTEDPGDINFLTPSHFLASGPNLTIYETEKDLRTRWHLVQKIYKDVWDRWSSEYLTQLSSRSKWRKPQKNISIDDVVIIQDGNLPPGKWALGRVVQLHPGTDGHVRVVTLKTKNGHIKRPIVKLSILPTHNPSQGENQARTEPAVEEEKETKRNRPKRVSFQKLALAMLLFFMAAIPTSQAAYHVSPLTNHNSIYFDPVTNMHLIRDHWRLIVYYDTSPYQEGNWALSKYLSYLRNMCSAKIEHSNCNGIISQLQHGFNELNHYNNILTNYQSPPTGRRQRRGLINGIGNIANSLFGVLDSQFAEKYEKDIINIKANENHLAALWKNQTSVVEAEFNLLKRTEENMRQHHKSINQIINSMGNSLHQVKSEVQNLSDATNFIESAMIANNILFTLKGIQDMLIDTITNIYNGKFNFHLLSPEQLRHELNIISGQLPKDLSSPIDNFNLTEVYNLLQVRAKLSSKYLIMEIKIPLIGRDVYEIFSLVPVPQVTGSEMTNVIPIAAYVAINLKKDALITITESDMKSCKQQNSDMVLCYLRKPIYHMTDDQSLCEKDPQTRKCKTMHDHCKNKWTELNKINVYFYFCCEACQLKLLCEDQITTVQLTRAGLLTVNQGCLIKTADFIVYTHRQEHSKISISNSIESPKISPINHMINISIPKDPTLDSTKDSEVSENQLHDIKQQIETMKNSDPLINQVSYHDMHHYTVIYGIIAVMIAAAAWYSVRRVRARRAPPPPQPRQESSNSDQCSECAKRVKVQCSDEPKGRVSPKVNPRVIYQNRGTSPVLRSILTLPDFDSA